MPQVAGQLTKRTLLLPSTIIYIAMKNLLILLLLVLPVLLKAQTSDPSFCQELLYKANVALTARDWNKARDYCETALPLCPGIASELTAVMKAVTAGVDKEKDDAVINAELAIRREREVAEERDKATAALSRFQISFAAYLISEAQKAFEQEDIRLAWRLTEVALQKNPRNEKALNLKRALPRYGAKYWLEAFGDFEISHDSSYISFITRDTNGSFTLNVLELGGEKTHRTFSDSYRYRYRYSEDSRYLLFFSGVDEEGNRGTLNVLELGGEKSHRTFSDTYLYHDNYSYSDSYRYSLDSRYLVFFSGVDKKSKWGTLNVLELGGDKSHRTFSDTYLYNQLYGNGSRYSSNSRYLVFLSRVDEEAERGTLNVLELGGKKTHRTFRYTYSGDNSYYYSLDNNYLVFLTEVEANRGTLNVLELGGKKTHRTFSDIYPKSYNIISRYLVFFSEVDEEIEGGTLNLLELGGEKTHRTFSDTYHYMYNKGMQHVAFFTGVNAEVSRGTLNVLELGGDKTHRTFSDTYIGIERYIYSFSTDNRYLIFYTRVDEEANKGTLNVLELGEDKSHRTFSNSHHNDYRFSEDSRYLVFVTEVEDRRCTLNVLELGGEKTQRRFSDSYFDLYSFSTDGRYLVFFTGLESGRSILNVLELGGEKTHRIFSDSYRNSEKYLYLFSVDSRYLVFFTGVDEIGGSGTLNVLELGGKKTHRTFSNTYVESDNYSFSPNSRYLVFFTEVERRRGTLNVLELEGEKTHRTFSESYCLHNRYGYSYCYSPDSRYLAFQQRDYKTAIIIELVGGKEVYEIKHNYNIETLKFLTNHNLLTTSTNPVTEGQTYKLTETNCLGNNGYWEYLLNTDYFRPLTGQERQTYGIVE